MGVKVTITGFIGQGRSQLNKIKKKKDQKKIAEAGILVEKAIQRIKTFWTIKSAYA